MLVIDDEKNILESIRMVLSYENYLVDTARDAMEGIAMVGTGQPDIILLDVKMPGIDGLTALKTIRAEHPLAEVIMISGHSGIDEALQAARLGALDFLEKPISRERLLLAVRNAADKVALRRENFLLRKQGEKKYSLVGQSRVMMQLRDLIERVAGTDSTVLINGESGTGKELIAREIHRLSRRKGQKFVQVNCAAIPDELIESELFGHEKGSFTGAHEKKSGKFDTAHRGTIFLDEIGDLSLKAQAKVLRVLEEGEVQPVGSSEVKKVDVRIIAATNKDLAREIREGNFREDLYFRLNVIPINSPSLRERRDDVPLLVEHFLAYFSEENNRRRKKFSAEVLASFQGYSWPGNVRELRNIVERLLIMSPGETITLADLPSGFVSEPPAAGEIPSSRTWREFKENSEKCFLNEKLKEFSFNIARTAREIELPRSNLYKKMAAYDIITPGNSEEDEESPSS